MGGVERSDGFCARDGITDRAMAAKRSRIRPDRDTRALIFEFVINSNLLVIERDSPYETANVGCRDLCELMKSTTASKVTA